MKSRSRGILWLSLAFVYLQLNGCTAPTIASEGRVYHCVATSLPEPTPGTWGKSVPLERFEYGDLIDTERSNVRRDRCGVFRVPQTAYLRYRVDGRVVEKRFDLSALTPGRVAQKTVEFHVDHDMVEVVLVTPVSGTWPVREQITKQ